ncbi:MAG: FxsA family protein [Pseudonocardiaceae bacterium]
MPVLLILLVVTLVELGVLIAVGNTIGVWLTIGLLLLASVVGAALLRREGTRTLIAFNEALRNRRPPHREVLDGMLIAVAAVFIVLPGFVSDFLGLLLLLPPTRALVRHRMLRSAERGAPGHFAPGVVIEGEVVDEPSAPRRTSQIRGPEPR